MPETESSMPEITIQGVTFQVAPVFKAGHVLTEVEASVLDQTRRENLRNNFAGEVRTAKQDAAKKNGFLVKNEKGEDVGDESQVTVDMLDVDNLVSEFDKYCDEYVFGVRASGTPRAPADPVEREALSIAKEKVKEAYRKKNFKISDVPAADILALAKGLLEKNPSIREEAKRRHAASAAITLADIDI